MRKIIPFLLLTSCVFFHGQRYHHFTTPTPLSENNFLILGLLGGREPWNSPDQGVRKLALKLRSRNLPGVHIETVENKKRDLALELIRNAFDRNRDGQVEDSERASARLILYGMSFGGAAVVKLARQLQHRNISVFLTVQIDSVGRNDSVIPSNVARAANLYQRNGLILKGEPEIRAADPQRTKILGNFEFDYDQKEVDLSGVPWFKKIFRTAHSKMNVDPDVWVKVEELILKELGKGSSNTR